MKKVLVLTVGTVLLVSSCGTYTGSGAYTGATFGSILGSAIGGISDGPRGSDVGTIIGMAGGAVAGAAIGAAADKARQREYEEQRARRHRPYNPSRQTSDDGVYYDRNSGYDRNNASRNTVGAGADDSGFDPTNSGDDRLYGDFGIQGAAPSETGAGGVVMRNLRFEGKEAGNILRSGDICKVVFEIVNRSPHTLYNVRPSVTETTGNKNIYVSQGICVEQIAPGKGIRYTAMVKAGDKLRDGVARFRISVTQDGRTNADITEEIEIATRR